MNSTPDDPKAWLWYDPATLEIRHIGFIREIEHEAGLSILPINHELGIKIATGMQRMSELALIADVDGNVALDIRKPKIGYMKFWQLIDLEKDRKIADDTFQSTEDEICPVKITKRTKDGFVVDVIRKVKNVFFYITMKNDPNYLIKKIDLYEHAANHGATVGIEIPVGVTGEYSIYVRYDAA